MHLLCQILYSLVSKIEVRLKYFSDKISESSHCDLTMFFILIWCKDSKNKQKKINFMKALWGTSKIWRPILPSRQHYLTPFLPAIQMSLWDFNFLHLLDSSFQIGLKKLSNLGKDFSGIPWNYKPTVEKFSFPCE